MKRKSLTSAALAAFTVVCFCFSFLSCVIVNLADLHSVTPEGEPENFEIFTGEYTGIKIDGVCEVLYYAAHSDTVILSVQPNLREYFSIEVIDGELVVRTTERINYGSKKPASLVVSSPSLKSVSISGVGGRYRDFRNINTFTTSDKIVSDVFSVSISGAGSCKLELEVSNLNADISGAGRLELSGKADTANLSLSGAGELNALALQTSDASINFSGTGSVSVSSSDNLQINASGVGSVEYRGTPRLSQNINGVVSIRQINY